MEKLPCDVRSFKSRLYFPDFADQIFFTFTLVGGGLTNSLDGNSQLKLELSYDFVNSD